MPLTAHDATLVRFLRTCDDLTPLTVEALQMLGIDVDLDKQLRRFVLTEGRPFSINPLAIGYVQQPRGQCFYQSISLSIGEELAYVEGFAIAPNSNFAHHHAWCVDAFDDLIDCTWPDVGLAYFGVQLPSEFVESSWRTRRAIQQKLRHKDYSLLSDYRNRVERD